VIKNKFCDEIRAACKATRKEGTTYAHQCWGATPTHHRKLLLTVSGFDDNLFCEPWEKLAENIRESVGSTARELRRSMNQCAAGLR